MSKAKATAPPLMENDHVLELLAILKKNSVSAKELTAVFGAVTAMEQQLAVVTGELTAVRQELSQLREAREQPAVRTLQSAANAMERCIAATRTQLAQIKAGIIEGCKNAVAAFREKGAGALHHLASFFHIKEGLKAMQGSLENSIRANNSAIDAIERFSDTYHEAGRRVQNMSRALSDQVPIEEAKPSGKLAKLLEEPFARQKTGCESILRSIGKALEGLDRLEAAAVKVQENRTEKLSVLKTIREHQEKAAQPKSDAPSPAKAKTQEASI